MQRYGSLAIVSTLSRRHQAAAAAAATGTMTKAACRMGRPRYCQRNTHTHSCTFKANLHLSTAHSKHKHCLTCICSCACACTCACTCTCTCPEHKNENDSVLVSSYDDYDYDNDNDKPPSTIVIQEKELAHLDDKNTPMPPPLPEPKVTFRRRVLPDGLVASTSPAGHAALLRALSAGTAAPYTQLTAHFDNQSSPASCGVTTLRGVLNACAVDPTAVRWQGGWRFFATDDMVLCECLDAKRVARAGITLNHFARLATCHGLAVDVKRPARVVATTLPDSSSSSSSASISSTTSSSLPSSSSSHSLDEFRRDLQDCMSTASHDPANPIFLVTSFCRAALGQTGDGHFSTIAAYDAATDSCLILDVARFKYMPYWTPVSILYNAMQPIDAATNLPRGWVLARRADGRAPYVDDHGNVADDGRCDADRVPAYTTTTQATCPLRPIQVQYCAAAWKRRHLHQRQQQTQHLSQEEAPTTTKTAKK